MVRRVLSHRGVTDPAELDLRLQHMLPARGLPGIDAATELLEQALRERWRIMIVGDFDADGATSTALSVLVLRAMGAEHVEYLVPDRFRFGYGLSPSIVEQAVSHEPRLIITVDNGISSVDGVAAANRAGIQVLVTDHHLPGAELPAAAAIVNPNLPGCDCHGKHLAGVGVIFYTLAALRNLLSNAGWFKKIEKPNLAAYLDLVALGTVADLVPLDRNNRILVEQGLRRLRAGRGRPGIHALLELARRDERNLVAQDLAFGVGPRLNAAGRLDDMSVGIECLLAADGESSHALAERLDELNRQRRELQQDMQQSALEIVDGLGLEQSRLPPALSLHSADWHQGIVGLVASRVKERFHRPVVAFAPAEQGSDQLKGSARSVPGLHIRDALEAVATRNPELIERFGGHAMAAGLTLQAANFEHFRTAFAEEAGRWLSPEALRGEVYSDGELSNGELDLDTAQALQRAGPWGQGFPEPVFDGVFTIEQSRIVGGHHLKMQLRVGDDRIDAIAFNHGENKPSYRQAHLLYRLDINEYRGIKRVQLIVTHFLPGK